MAHLVVMGVSGSGKSTVARRLADRLGWPFAEADDFHPPANVAKMSRGVPLEDADRMPWLADIARWVDEHERRGVPTVVACSALRRAYRDVLRDGAPDVRFVHLHGPAEVIERRMTKRSGHFMKPEMLRSQLATLEELQPDEDGMTVDLARSPEEIVERILTATGQSAVPP